jgi:hypothetical protein
MTKDDNPFASLNVNAQNVPNPFSSYSFYIKGAIEKNRKAVN